MCAMNPRLLRPLATGFNPRSIANCVLWLDASTTGTLGNTNTGTGGVTDNGPVKFWRDQAGSANATNSGADSVVPTFKAASLNNRGSLDFDGGDDLIGDLSQTYTGQTVFAVARTTVAAAAGNNFARLYTQAASDFTVDPDFGSAGKYMPLIRNGTQSAIGSWADNSVRASINITQNVWFIVCSRHTGSQVQNSLNNGTPQTYNHSLNYTVGKYRICNDLSSFQTGFWQGGVAEVITYARSISDAERTRVFRGLGRKWGITVP
jgi:hypothetical protein